MRDVILKVHEKSFGKREIASLALLCDEAYAKGDRQAAEILEAGSKELALMVTTCAKRIQMTDESFDLVCSGGSIKRVSSPMRQMFSGQIGKALKKAKIIFPENEPAMGAVLLAIDSFKKGS